MRIAIVGGGGAGLAAAWLLESQHEVTLYERADRLGGHADTRTVQVGSEQAVIDGGFEFLSEAMYPTFHRLLRLLQVPLIPYTMTVTLYQRDGDGYTFLPPLRRGLPALDGMRPRQLADLWRFNTVLDASRSMMESRDTALTLEQFLDRLPLSAGFKERFLYPFLQAGWCIPLDDLKALVAYGALSYSYLHRPQGLRPARWLDIAGGTQTYISAVAQSLARTAVRLSTPVTRIAAAEGGYLLEDAGGGSAAFDHVILATNAPQACDLLDGLAAAQARCKLLRQVEYFEATIAVHGDTRLMPPERRHWSIVNMRCDSATSQSTVWKRWRNPGPLFKSWVTYEANLPEPLYALEKYLHPKMNAAYFGAQRRLGEHQGQDNLWLAGIYTHGIDCHESAILSAVAIARHLAPDSPRLRQLAGTG